MQTGAVTVYTHDADAAAAHRALLTARMTRTEDHMEEPTAWCVEGPEGAIGAIGLETAPLTKESPYPELRTPLTAEIREARCHGHGLCRNNWDRPITITETSA